MSTRIASYHRDFPGVPFFLYDIPAQEPESTRIALADLRSEKGTDGSKRLSAVLADAVQRGVTARIAVTGADDELAAETLIDALRRLNGIRLEGLQVAFIGGPGPVKKLEAEVLRTGATFAHVSHPAP